MSIRSCKTAAVLVVFSTFLASACLAQPATQQPGYYGDETKKGWWWYEKMIEPDKDEEKPPGLTNEIQGPKKYPRDFTLDNVTTEDLWTMHPDDFQSLYDTIHKKSVQYPDDEKAMKEYFVMTDMARRKALAFANSNQAFLMKNPDYNMAGTIPLAAPGKAAANKMQSDEKSQVIRQGQDDHALIFFWKPGCQFCEAQASILKIFTDKYEWNIKKVNITENPAAGNMFGVQTVPMVILVKKGNEEHVTVSVGVATAYEIEEKVYRGMKMLGGEDASSYSTYEYEKQNGQEVKAPLTGRKGPKR